MKYNVKKVNYLNLKHDLVNSHFKGHLEFLNYAVINPGETYRAIYRSNNPEIRKMYGYKEYFSIFRTNEGKYAYTDLDIEKLQVNAVLCINCNTVLYSIHRHDFHSCDCKNETYVDGGYDYLRWGARDLRLTQHGKLNLLTDRFTKAREKSGKNKKTNTLGDRTSKGRNQKIAKRSAKVKTRKSKSK